MSLYDSAAALLASGRIPPVIVRGLAHIAVALVGCKMRLDERRQTRSKSATATPVTELYFVDGYHGGVIFWDWLILPGGGLWKAYNWPLCIRPVVKKTLRDERRKIVLDFDAYTYEWMTSNQPGAVRLLCKALTAKKLELVNGSYAQPFGFAESGESFMRQLEYGQKAMLAAFGTVSKTFWSQEPSYFGQLPQILRSFGYDLVVFRTQWAAFGSDPSCDADLVTWQAPDGSGISTVPRYSFQNYSRQMAKHPGLAAGSLGMGELPDWAPESLAPFSVAAALARIGHPLVSDLKDVNLPDAPLPRAAEIAGMKNVTFTTPNEYIKDASPPTCTVTYGPSDIPCTLPWGLQGEVVPIAVAAAESSLLAAERLDAIAFLQGFVSHEASIEDAWKSLCKAQHHDLYVCGPWLSRAHRSPMSDVATDFAELARREADRVAQEALYHIASAPGGDVMVFNPAPFARNDYAEVVVPYNIHDFRSGLAVLSDGERAYPCQVVTDEDQGTRIGFVPNVPALGLVHLKLVAAKKEMWHGEIPQCSEEYSLRMQPSSDGNLVVMGHDGVPVIEGFFFTCMRDGLYFDSRTSVTQSRWIANGPVFDHLEIRGNVASLPFVLNVVIYKGTGRVEANVVFDFGTKGVYIGPQKEDNLAGLAYSIQDEKKLCVNFLSPNRRICCKSPFWISDVEGNRITGVPWIGLESENGTGIAFFNRGTRGYHMDRSAGLLRNVLAWGPREWIYASDDSFTRGHSAYTALRGSRTYEFALAPYRSRIEAEKQSIRYALPVRAIWRKGERASLLKSWSPLRLNLETVIITAYKVHKGALYLRLWNASDRATSVPLPTPDTMAVFSATPDFRVFAETPINGNIDIAPWGITTLRIGTESRSIH